MLLTVSRRLQRFAQPLLTQQAFFNGFGYPFIIEAVIILLALYYGASDLQMGFIFAAPHLTGFAAVFAPQILAGVDMSAIWSRMWWTRGLIAILYLVVPLVPGIEGDTRVWLVVLVQYLVGVARALGMTVYVPVLKALTPQRDISSTMARVMTSTQTGTLVCRVVAFVWLGSGLLGEHYALLALIVMGILSNSYTATLVGKLPATGEMEASSLGGVLQVLRGLAASRATRRVAVLTLVQTGMFIFAGYTVSYCKNVLQYGGTRIFFLMLAASVVSIAATHMVRIIGERITTRLLLLLTTLLTGVCALLWALPGLLPCGNSFWFYLLLFPLTGVGASVAGTKLMSLQSEYLPKNSAARVAIAFQMLTLLGGAGSLGLVQLLQAKDGGWLAAQLDGRLAAAGLHEYSAMFLVWALAALVVWLIARSLPARQEQSLHKELSLLLPQNLYDIYRTYTLSNLDPQRMRGQGRLVLEGVMLNASALSHSLLRESLHTTEISRRYSALRMLVCRPQADVLPEVLAEAADEQSPLRFEALTALGFMKEREAIPLLRRLSGDADPLTAANAMKSLLRLGEVVPEEEVLALWQRCPNNHARWGLAAGLADADRLCALLTILNHDLPLTQSPTWRAMLLQLAADVRNAKADMVDVLDYERQRRETGLELALADWPEALEERLSAESIVAAWRRNDLPSLAPKLTEVCRLPSPCGELLEPQPGGQSQGAGSEASDAKQSQRICWARGRRGLQRLEWAQLLNDPVTAAGLIFLISLFYLSPDEQNGER